MFGLANMINGVVQLFELTDDLWNLSFFSRCKRCFWFWCRLARFAHCAEQHSSLLPLKSLKCCAGENPFTRFLDAFLLHADRTQRLRSHLMTESCERERNKYLILVLWRLIMFRDYRNWTYFASACDALLFSEWWKHWMPLVSIFMDIVRNLTASMRHNLFWWFDCAPFCTLVAHQFRIMRFFVTGYFFDLNEQTNWKLLKMSLISVENGL